MDHRMSQTQMKEKDQPAASCRVSSLRLLCVVSGDLEFLQEDAFGPNRFTFKGLVSCLTLLMSTTRAGCRSVLILFITLLPLIISYLKPLSTKKNKTKQ